MLRDKNLYYVGGIVRDKILGIESFDTDFCFEGNAIEFAQKHNLNIIKTNPDFGTVRVEYNGKNIDIASTRTETYPKKGHLPKVENIGCALKDDLVRRDFTINAMAKRTTNGKIVDYFNGIKDIENKVLRVLHKDSFIDDPTRIIRGLKFSVRFNFELEEETKKLQEEYLNNINYDMSYHRIKKELVETFSLNIPEAFDKFVEQRIYKLLGENIKKPNLKGIDIFNAIKNVETEHVWFMYIAPFLKEDTPLPLTRAEKRILSQAERLKTQLPNNNTPQESVILFELLNKNKSTIIHPSNTEKVIPIDETNSKTKFSLTKILKTKFHLRFVFNPLVRYLSNCLGEELYTNHSKRTIPITVSLTSYEDRFEDLEIALYSIFRQTTRADRIVLWLSDKYNLLELPYSITKYIKNGLEIKFVKDIGSYTKIIYALKEYGDTAIVTADDDIYYPKDWLENLYHSFLSSPDDIHVHRAHRVLFNKNKMFPYEKWNKHISEETARYDNFLTGVGGVLYPPNCFINEVLREDVFLKYCPNADDIWLWIMALMSNKKIRVVKNHSTTLTCTNIFRQIGFTKGKTLYSQNQNGGNDKQLENLIKLYGQNIFNKLIKQ